MFVVIVMVMTEVGPVFEVPASGSQAECAKVAMRLRRTHRTEIQGGTYAASYARVQEAAR